ncbi:MAG: hypothetical protein B7Y43_00205 [Sphingomonas sp. 28-62-20]|nr:MAG: hypothetical protein B7Y43_00205 [Sphingomonas sp. 28-62-20]
MITERSGCVDRAAMQRGLAALLLPDIARCHEHGYARIAPAPDARAQGAGATPDHRLFQSHILADWFIHFGTGSARRRQGWAYRRMLPFAARYADFFETATRLGLRRAGPLPDSPRGFAHTMVEYAIDTHLAGQRDLSLSVGEVQRAAAGFAVPAISAMLAALGVVHDAGALPARVAAYRARVARARDVRAFAFRAGVAKFGLDDRDDSVDYVGEFLDTGLRSLRSQGLDEAIDATAAFVAARLDAPAPALTG